MGFLQGAISYTAYEVLSVPGPEFLTGLLDGLSRGRIGPIDIDLGRDRTVGFATWEDPLDAEFTETKVFFDSVVAFSFRIDRLSVPSTTLKLYVRRRVAEVLAATHRTKLPKQERDELTDQLRTDLLRKTVPAITACDVIWDTATGRLRFFSTSQAINDEFLTHLREILKVETRPMNTVGILERGLDERTLHDVYHLLPTTFLAPGEIRLPQGGRA